jgi:hypothetical protein
MRFRPLAAAVLLALATAPLPALAATWQGSDENQNGDRNKAREWDSMRH